MEVYLSPDKEARLQHYAARTGKDAAHLVEEAVDRMLQYDARFIEAVEEGRAAARRGELLEHEEVVEGVERMPKLMRVRWPCVEWPKPLTKTSPT
jgi:predicted transcriptional regulator